MLSARSGEAVSTINTRHKGFVRLAMQCAADMALKASADDIVSAKSCNSGTSCNGSGLRVGDSTGSNADEKKKMYLVPVYSFSENEMLDNVQLPRALQEWSIKTLRANVLFLPYVIPSRCSA